MNPFDEGTNSFSDPREYHLVSLGVCSEHIKMNTEIWVSLAEKSTHEWSR